MQFKLFATAAILATAATALPTTGTTTKLAAREESQDIDLSKLDVDLTLPLEHILLQLESIPDDVLEKGKEALQDYLIDNGIIKPEDLEFDSGDSNNDNSTTSEDSGSGSDDPQVEARAVEDEPLEARASPGKIAKCVGSVTYAIASGVFPAAKIVRIKKYIDALGGVRQSVRLVLGATSAAEKAKYSALVIRDLGAEFLGVAAVKDACF